MTESEIIQVAKVCHEANRTYCETIGDSTQVPWDDAAAWQRISAINGVKFHLEYPHADPSAGHVCWMNQKIRDGWVWGEVKDEEKKTHPCIVDYWDLPKDQQIKDDLFCNIVHAMRNGLSDGV